MSRPATGSLTLPWFPGDPHSGRPIPHLPQYPRQVQLIGMDLWFQTYGHTGFANTDGFLPGEETGFTKHVNIIGQFFFAITGSISSIICRIYPSWSSLKAGGKYGLPGKWLLLSTVISLSVFNNAEHLEFTLHG